MIRCDDQVVPIEKIDTTDHTCSISLHTDPSGVVSSIQRVGLINPPLVSRKGDSTYRIVCGFRRIKACLSLGWREIKVRVLVGDFSKRDLLQLAILDNRSHRPLDVVEQARAIQMLGAQRGQNNLEALSSLLGFPPNKKVFQKISGLGRLPEVIQAGVVDGTISFEAAADLCKFSPEDAVFLFDFLKVLKLSQNKEKETITLVQEIAIREELKICDILECKDIRMILDSRDLNRNEKGSKVRAYLKRRRFPSLAKAEERFLKEVKTLKLKKGLHITAPPYFEGSSFTLRMTFKNLDEFHERCRALNTIGKKPGLKRILQPYDLE